LPQQRYAKLLSRFLWATGAQQYLTNSSCDGLMRLGGPDGGDMSTASPSLASSGRSLRCNSPFDAAAAAKPQLLISADFAA
jgi:hypothetical protein